MTALGLSLLPIALTGPGPAAAGGGFGMTLTAEMEGQDQGLLVGTVHTVRVTVADTPGEASLRMIQVLVIDADPTQYPVTCDDGVNDAMSLEPRGVLHCTTDVAARAGFRTVRVTVNATVPGEANSITRTQILHYTGIVPPPPPPPKPALVVPPSAASGNASNASGVALGTGSGQNARTDTPTANVPGTNTGTNTGSGSSMTLANPPITVPANPPAQQRASIFGPHGLPITGTNTPLIAGLALAAATLGAALLLTPNRHRRVKQSAK